MLVQLLYKYPVMIIDRENQLVMGEVIGKDYAYFIHRKKKTGRAGP